MNRAIPLISLLLGGCAYDEGLIIENLHGKVHIPGSAATRELVDKDGNSTIVGPDVRLIGPVYLGLYPSILPANVAEKYPYPEVGPQFKPDIPGDTYPYGGTTVGDLRFACFEFLSCKLSSGRFVDYQDIVDWFAQVGTPLTDADGAEVKDGEYLRQTCFNLLDATTDDEVRITAYEDNNGDGTIDEKDLDFVYDPDNDEFVGDFTVWQQEFFWDQHQKDCTPGKDCTGFSLWGWMDAPSNLEYTFSTCELGNGFEIQEYNADFFGGRAYDDVLNAPSKYITSGDVVSSGDAEGQPYVWSDVDDQPDIYLDYVVE